MVHQLELMAAQKAEYVRNYNQQYNAGFHKEHYLDPEFKKKKQDYALDYYAMMRTDDLYMQGRRDQGARYQEEMSEVLAERRRDVMNTEEFFYFGCNRAFGKQSELHRQAQAFQKTPRHYQRNG